MPLPWYAACPPHNRIGGALIAEASNASGAIADEDHARSVTVASAAPVSCKNGEANPVQAGKTMGEVRFITG
jgi:hypothetical protein